jgi:signal transduction histidine kinase
VHTSVPIELKADIQPEISAFGDGMAIARAIDAILENCLKYHNGQIHIDIGLADTKGKIALTIADRGIGFERKDSKAIFERFYRVGDEMTRQQSGTGLGLYLCREIIRAHGGKVEAHSEGPGKGAEFTITLKKS